VTDWNEFRKLFKVPIPVPAHAEYYLGTLDRTAEHAGVLALAAEFEAFEKRCPRGVGAAKQGALEALVAHLGGTNAYTRMRNATLPAKSSVLDRRAHYAGLMWVGVDLVSANYHVLKRFDHEGELCESWEALCDKVSVDPFLARSKPFRQAVFGNLDPKRTERFQREVIENIWERLETTECELVYLEKDELIIVGRDPIAALFEAASAEAQRASVPARVTLRRLMRFAKDRYVIEHFDAGADAPSHRTLFGVPGNRLMFEIKRRILCEPIDERDLLFLVDGEVAKWVTKS
jgi:hypothetical protein